MIDIAIAYTDHVWPWRYDLSSDTLDLHEAHKGTGAMNFRYSETAEECFQLAWEAKEQMLFWFWSENQLEFEF